MDEEDDATTYVVVVNDEEQYSIWPQDRPLPAGWRGDGTSGLKKECLEHINEVWTDMRPLSLRRRMAEHESGTRLPPVEHAGPSDASHRAGAEADR
jgi:MbtH protein